MTELNQEVNINKLVEDFMKDYIQKTTEVELPEANRYVDDVLIPKYTSGLDAEASVALVKAITPVLSSFLTRESEPSEKTVEELTVAPTEETISHEELGKELAVVADEV